MKKRKLLLVDDMKEVHDKLTQDIKKRYEVDSVFNEQEALNRIRQNNYDLVITDCQLSNSGFEGLNIIKAAKNKGFRAIMMSKGNYRNEALKAGANGFIFKKQLYNHLLKYNHQK